MKWPEKPREHDLHQLEERLIALRIPLLQIRELPREGQYSLHWIVNNSELYKKSGIVVDDNWFQEVTESAEDIVRDLLEVLPVKLRTILTENKNISVTD